MRRSARGDSDWGTTAAGLGYVVTLILAATMYTTVPSF